MRQMRGYAVEAIALLAGRGADDIAEDRLLELALTKLAENVGEAARRVPSEVQRGISTIPWADAVGTRNRLAHGYDSIDAQRLWATVAHAFPALVDALDAVLE